MSKIKYAITYEHLREEIDNKECSVYKEFIFNEIVENANKYRLELSDDNFIRFYDLKISRIDIGWIMNIMNSYDKSFIDALISYITFSRY